MTPTDLTSPLHFHKVVDCQWACPAHTPVPEYIRLVAAGRYADAYMVNWTANVFPGILGRTCDRPCEPACRRARVEKEPVAICRLKRVAADYKGDVRPLMPRPTTARNGKRVALVGGGPASLTVARDLAPLGYDCTIFDQDPKAGGMMRTRIPRFRVPESVIDEEVDFALQGGVTFCGNTRIDSLGVLVEGFDAVFVGSGAPRGQDLAIPGRAEAAANIHIGTDWLANIWFGHVKRIGRRVVVIGGGNTAMDCCRSARRLGGEEVATVVRSTFEAMKAQAWEKADVAAEGVRICNNLVPSAFIHENGRLTGVAFEPMRSIYENGRRRLVPTGGPVEVFPCDDAVIAIGQEAAFPWIERDLGVAFDEWNMPVFDPLTMQSTNAKVFFGGDAAIGPKNIITAVAHGHEAAISIDALCMGRSLRDRPMGRASLVTQPLAPVAPRHAPEVSVAARRAVPRLTEAVALADIGVEVELGFDPVEAVAQAGRCLECDRETVFTARLCVECKACVVACPTNCITFTRDGEEAELRKRLNARAENLSQDLYVGAGLVSGKVMVKNEDICLHCGL